MAETTQIPWYSDSSSINEEPIWYDKEILEAANGNNGPTTLDGVVLLENKATGADLLSGTPDKWIDAALLKASIANIEHSSITSIDLKPVPNEVNTFTVEITWIDDKGKTTTTVDPTPIVITGPPKLTSEQMQDGTDTTFGLVSGALLKEAIETHNNIFIRTTIPPNTIDSDGYPIEEEIGYIVTFEGLSLLYTKNALYTRKDGESYIFIGNRKPLYTYYKFKARFTCTGIVKLNSNKPTMTLEKIGSDGLIYTNNTDIPAGTYNVYGDAITAIKFLDNNFTSIHIESNSEQTDAYRMFYGLNNLTEITANENTFANVTNIKEICRNNFNLKSFPTLDTSKVTDMYGAWYNCGGMSTFPILDISSVTNLNYAWASCYSLVCMKGLVNNNVAPASAFGVFSNNFGLLRPNATEQASILAGNTWTNDTPC